MTIDIAKLKALAEAAKNDQWYTVDQLIIRAVYADPAELIAAANPATVLELLTEIEQLQDSSKMRAIRSLRGDVADLLAERDKIKAENEALRRGMKGDYDLDAWIDWEKEASELRKDAGRYRFLRQHGPVHSARMLDEQIDAAMSKEASHD